MPDQARHDINLCCPFFLTGFCFSPMLAPHSSMIISKKGETMNLLEEKLARFDPDVDGIIRDEMRRNEETINLIASENYPPKSLMKAISSMLSGIYSEGYPGERYYRGLENVDKIESLALERAKEIFGAEHANVQALSGSGANIAAYLSL